MPIIAHPGSMDRSNRLALRMSVQEFGATRNLDLPTPDGRGWLLMSALPNQTIHRLAELTRISEERISGIAVPPPMGRTKNPLPLLRTMRVPESPGRCSADLAVRVA
jgi:hypothetical protein